MNGVQEDRYIEQIRALKAEVEMWRATEWVADDAKERIAELTAEIDQWRGVGRKLVERDLIKPEAKDGFLLHSTVEALLAKGEQ